MIPRLTWASSRRASADDELFRSFPQHLLVMSSSPSPSSTTPFSSAFSPSSEPPLILPPNFFLPSSILTQALRKDGTLPGPMNGSSSFFLPFFLSPFLRSSYAACTIAFILFGRWRRPALKLRHASRSAGEMSALVAEEWRGLCYVSDSSPTHSSLTMADPHLLPSSLLALRSTWHCTVV
jgi:hypothetical protein